MGAMMGAPRGSHSLVNAAELDGSVTLGNQRCGRRASNDVRRGESCPGYSSGHNALVCLLVPARAIQPVNSPRLQPTGWSLTFSPTLHSLLVAAQIPFNWHFAPVLSMVQAPTWEDGVRLYTPSPFATLHNSPTACCSLTMGGPQLALSSIPIVLCPGSTMAERAPHSHQDL
ncbi:unnamed protein product [Boreogadus saida]